MPLDIQPIPAPAPLPEELAADVVAEGGQLTKRKLVALLVIQHPYIKKKDIEDIVGSALAAIKGHLQGGESIEFRGIFTMMVKASKARLAQNIHTGVSLSLPARNRVRFKLSKEVQLPPIKD